MSAVVHQACPDCGSKDNLAVYENGGEHCFSPGCSRHKTTGLTTSTETPTFTDDVFDTTPDDPMSIFIELVDLPGRSLSFTTCSRYGYGKVKKSRSTYQVAPFQDRSGRPVAWKFRAKGKAFHWEGDRTNMLPFFGQHLQSNGKRIIVTEGELDALSCSQALGNTWPAVSLPDGAGSWKKSFEEGMSWLDGFSEIVLCFDMDGPGREAAVAAAEFLPPGKVSIVSLPLKDASEMLQAGRQDELKRCLWNASRWAPPGIVTGKDILPALRGKHRPPVAHFPYPKLESMTRGIRAGEIILMVAASGGGKSTWCRSVIHGLLESGVKVGVLSLEETMDQFTVPLVGFMLGKNLRVCDDDPTLTDEFAQAVESLEDKLVLYDDDGSRSPDTIFDRARYMQAACGCSVIVLDHLTVLIAAGADNGVAAADRLMAKLEAHVKKTQMTLIVVMHLRKTSEGKSFEQGKVPTMSDIRGSGLIPGFSHTIIARSRNQEDNDGGQLHLLKCRLGGTGMLGAADELTFDQGTGMLVASDDPVAMFQAVGDDY